jgi:hypothetical protein
MIKYKDYILHRMRFPSEELHPFVDELHANGQQYVTIIDSSKSNFIESFLTYF